MVAVYEQTSTQKLQWAWMLTYAKCALKKKKKKTLLSHEVFGKVMPLDTMP